MTRATLVCMRVSPVAAVLALALAGCGGTPVNTPVAAPSPTASPCAQIVRDVYRSVDGVEHAEPAPDRVRVTTYADEAGTRWDELRPPAGWDPVAASDAQLAAFGFNPRPADGPERAEWEKAFANYRGAEPGEPATENCPVQGLKFGAPY